MVFKISRKERILNKRFKTKYDSKMFLDGLPRILDFQFSWGGGGGGGEREPADIQLMEGGTQSRETYRYLI